MRLKTKPKPKVGDKRIVVRFAWLPTLVEYHDQGIRDVFKVWLERYASFEELCLTTIDGMNIYETWEEKRTLYLGDAFDEAEEIKHFSKMIGWETTEEGD